MMGRRAFIAGVAGILAAPLAAEAQQAGKVVEPLGLSWPVRSSRHGQT
jgi:hypothetical protein